MTVNPEAIVPSSTVTPPVAEDDALVCRLNGEASLVKEAVVSAAELDQVRELGLAAAQLVTRLCGRSIHSDLPVFDEHLHAPAADVADQSPQDEDEVEPPSAVRQDPDILPVGTS